jgi:hypothetical protein
LDNQEVDSDSDSEGEAWQARQSTDVEVEATRDHVYADKKLELGRVDPQQRLASLIVISKQVVHSESPVQVRVSRVRAAL